MRKIIATGLIAAALLTGASSAGAATKYKVDLNGYGGSYALDAAGAAVITGSATGAPFDGTYTAVLSPDDGTFPAPGECEPATASVRVEGSRRGFVELTAAADVCGKWVDQTYVETQRLTGRYTVTAASKRPLVGTEGFLEVSLATEGRGGFFAIST